MKLILLIAIGRLFIFLWSKFPLPKWLDDSRVGMLHHCTLCAGVWIYSILFIIYRVDLLNYWGFHSVYLVGGMLGGGIISYLMWLLEAGWNSQFTVVIE